MICEKPETERRERAKKKPSFRMTSFPQCHGLLTKRRPPKGRHQPCTVIIAQMFDTVKGQFLQPAPGQPCAPLSSQREERGGGVCWERLPGQSGSGRGASPQRGAPYPLYAYRQRNPHGKHHPTSAELGQRTTRNRREPPSPSHREGEGGDGRAAPPLRPSAKRAA